MVAATLRSVSALDGVLCVALLSSDGRVQAQDYTPPYEGVLFEQSFDALIEAADQHRVATGAHGPRSFQAALEEGFVVLRELALDGQWIAVLAGVAASIPRLNVALNVLEARLARTSGDAAPASAPEPARGGTRSEPNPPSPSLDVGRNVGVSQVLRDSDEYMRRLQSSRTDLVDRSAIEHFIKVSLRHLGDDAARLIGAEMRDLDVTPLNCSDVDFIDLIERVGRHLPPDVSFEQFRLEALGDGG